MISKDLEMDFWLPDELRPLYYDLVFDVNIQFGKYSGVATIYFKVLKPISYIPLHSTALNVTTESVALVEDNLIQLETILSFTSYYDSKFDYWITKFTDDLKKGEYIIRLKFNGNLNTQHCGIYKDIYWNEKTRHNDSMIITKCGPTFARLIFPCFDEPHKKSIFKITIKFVRNHTFNQYYVLSNMDIEYEYVDAQTHMMTVQFHETPLMSTYLLGLFISNFNYTSYDNLNLPIRMYARSAIIEYTAYALEMTSMLIYKFLQYFDHAYPLPKLDIVVIAEFSVGALENWGLIFFRESLILYDKLKCTTTTQQRIVTLLANQLAHMWFGNLVTMQSWSDLWLYEGLTTYLEYEITDKFDQFRGIQHQFLILELIPAIEIDAKSSTFALNRQVNSNEEIWSQYDKICYSKGASLLRMIDNYLGKRKFCDIIRKFLKSYAYANANINDFFNILEDYVTDSITKNIIQSYIDQPGIPLITVVNSTKNIFKITQQIFFSCPTYEYRNLFELEHLKWTIPISYVTNVDLQVKYEIFSDETDEHLIQLPYEKSVKWIKCNKDFTGYYRTNYSDELWHQLTIEMCSATTKFSISDRAQLLDDAFALADALILDYKIPLNLLQYLDNEKDFVPWYIVCMRLKKIYYLLHDTKIHDKFVKYVHQIFNNAYQLVTWNECPNHHKSLLRIVILETACAFGLPIALNEVSKRFKMWLSKPSKRPHPDLRSTVYFYGMQVNADKNNWQTVNQLYLAEQDIEEKQRLMRALTATHDHTLLSRLYETVKKSTNLTLKHFIKCLYYMSCNEVGQELIWNFVRENWLRLTIRFGSHQRNQLNRMLIDITERFSTIERLNEMREFFYSNPKSINSWISIEALKNVNHNIFWIKNRESQILDWLDIQSDNESFHSARSFIIPSIVKI